jgi:iron complex outermembrane receptor protein
MSSFWMRRSTAAHALLCLGVIATGTAAAETDAAEPIDEIVVTSLRMNSSLQDAARSISVVEKSQIQDGRQMLALDESLAGVAGLYLQSSQNFSQDLRISIRGYGARSSFGVRGVRIFVDGIPESLPDGQSQVDGIDLGTADQIEVLRGPSSTLYGNAAGGVIAVTSELGSTEPYVEGSISAGDYDFQRYQLKAAASGDSLDYLVSASYTAIDGYRAHSEFESTSLAARFAYRPSEQDELRFSLSVVDQPIAQDAGGIDAAQVEDDPSSARARNVLFDAGEELDQQKVTALYKTDRLGGELTIRNYYANRDFANKLPFTGGGAVDLQRFYYGLGAQYASAQSSSSKIHFVTGFDLDRQDDDRKRFDNNEGAIEALVFDQNEKVESNGVFVQTSLEVSESWNVSAGLRFDDVDFDVTDRFVADGDDSGVVSFQEWSPSLSASYTSDAGVWFAAFGTSFETPTTTEFANPSGAGGFNQSLRPQTSESLEIGFKSMIGRMALAMAAFHIDLEDELVPFELATAPGRTFYANAGASTRKGLEAELSWSISENLSADLSWTWSDFSFDQFELDGEDFSGNRQPGLPKQFGFFALSYSPRESMTLDFELRYAGELFATNDNQVSIDSYTVSNLRFAQKWQKGQRTIQAFIGINNLFDERYNSNIRINAFGGRYFEPAAERNWYAGVSARFGR